MLKITIGKVVLNLERVEAIKARRACVDQRSELAKFAGGKGFEERGQVSKAINQN